MNLFCRIFGHKWIKCYDARIDLNFRRCIREGCRTESYKIIIKKTEKRETGIKFEM